ncbi:MAG: glycosyltransferase [Alphaproteobacteria bacterium]|nr:glycosyltransferase [Alphaproteobacteria bacterium]MCB9792631.1 glycosyltransferase [Alphaproteobacteria bacterium]
MPVLLQLVHGYPPREIAGTELYAARVTEALVERGWTVHVVAATRAPGRAHGSRWTEPLPGGGRLVRVVNNLPWRPLGQAERDPLIEAVVEAAAREAAPDLVHIQHLLFLSAWLELPAPALLTLHDAWGWCARGGTLLREGLEPCPGPAPERCAPCYQAWGRGSAAEHRLGRAAGRLSPYVSAERLHGLWRRLPGGLRRRALSGAPPRPAPTELARRQEAVAAAFQRAALRVAPSRFLAEAAEAQGLGPVQHLPHGVDPLPQGAHDGPFVFLGSLVPHKGAHLVARAWSRGADLPPLEIWGPATDADYAARLPRACLRGPAAPQDVPALLGRARALVMGSTWPENAPLVALEARAAGCPVIAPAIGGLPELIEDGLDGRLYPPGDVDALAAAIREFAGPEILRPRPAPRFDAHVERLTGLYRQLLP